MVGSWGAGQWQIKAGEEVAGCAIHIVEETIDTGPVLGQLLVPIHACDTGQSVKSRLTPVFIQLLDQVLDELTSGKAVGRIQDESKARYFHKYEPKLGKFEWNELSADEVERHVRAFSGRHKEEAFARIFGQYYFIQEVELVSSSRSFSSGAVFSVSENGLIIGCKDNAVHIKAMRHRGNEDS